MFVFNSDNSLKSMNETERQIPYFPLNISLLPGEDIPLRIFEPRYKQLITECEKKDITFGIPYMKNSIVSSYGSEVKLKQVVAKNSKNEMVITVEGVSNFEVISFDDKMPGKLYGGGKIRLINNDQPISNMELMRMLIYYTDQLDPSFLKEVHGNEILLNDVAKALNLTSDDKFRFISIERKTTREKFLLGQLKYLMKLREQEKLLKNDYYLN